MFIKKEKKKEGKTQEKKKDDHTSFIKEEERGGEPIDPKNIRTMDQDIEFLKNGGNPRDRIAQLQKTSEGDPQKEEVILDEKMQASPFFGGQKKKQTPFSEESKDQGYFEVREKEGLVRDQKNFENAKHATIDRLKENDAYNDQEKKEHVLEEEYTSQPFEKEDIQQRQQKAFPLQQQRKESKDNATEDVRIDKGFRGVYFGFIGVLFVLFCVGGYYVWTTRYQQPSEPIEPPKPIEIKPEPEIEPEPELTYQSDAVNVFTLEESTALREKMNDIEKFLQISEETSGYGFLVMDNDMLSNVSLETFFPQLVNGEILKESGWWYLFAKKEMYGIRWGLVIDTADAIEQGMLEQNLVENGPIAVASLYAESITLPTSSQTFSRGEYGEFATYYYNFENAQDYSLDYVLEEDGSRLYIGTSKEIIRSILDEKQMFQGGATLERSDATRVMPKETENPFESQTIPLEEEM
jgi:hypothetical protein